MEGPAVAIIGMAGQFPGAATVHEFWANVAAGKDSVSHFAPEEIESRDRFSREQGPDYVRARAILAEADRFDAEFFGVQPREAELMDPQHRLFLETCWTALESAGYDPGQYPGLIGVFGGCSLNTYLLANLATGREFLDELTGNYQIGEFATALGNDKDFLATRVAYKLNLRGPSMTVQSACATSLVAVSQACQSLLLYQCDMALAGGVSVTFPQKRGHVYQEGGMASEDGRCRPFDAQATGTVFGHGVGAVVLKRLEDAVSDGDDIWAVIRGFAVNNDGSQKVGYMAPGVDGQADVIAAAQAMAGVPAETITYIEAHGTATPLGDPIEVAALTKAFRAGTERTGFCAIGTAKANIGHIEHAAGVTGLIKTALSLRHRMLPPLANFEAPNPHIDFANSPFYINRNLTPWESEGPLRAGVSAFGVGGTNAHVVLEQAPAAVSEPPQRAAQLLCLSARSRAVLKQSIENLGRHFEIRPETNLADAAYTLQAGRRAFEHRAIAVCSSSLDAAFALTAPDSRRVQLSGAPLRNPRVVFLFPGQGAQHPGMGEELYRHEPVFRQQVDECAEILAPLLGSDLRLLLYPAPGQRPAAAERLQQTRYAQPALFVTEYALAKLWMSWGVVPQAMAGHSVGEFVAAALSGVMSRADALRLVASRGLLTQEQPGGAMLSVRLSEHEVEPLLNGHLSLAAVNGPKLTVVAGPFPAVEKLERELESRQVEFRRLATSHAFHSPMMDAVREPFLEEVRRFPLSAPKIPYVSGVTGNWIEPGEATDPEYWATHLRHAVRFADCAARLLEVPNTILLETGPGKTLITLARQQAGSAGVPMIASLGSPGDGQQQPGTTLEALGRLWMAGVTPDWNRLHGNERRHRTGLPTYPFERKKYWVEPPPVETGGKASNAGGPLAESASTTPDNPTITSMPIITEAAFQPDRNLRLQSLLASLFQDLSGSPVPPEAAAAPFLDLGFDSLFLTQATQAVKRKFGVKVTFRQLLDQLSSIAALAAFLDQQLPAEAFPAEPAPAAASQTATVQPAPTGPATSPIATSPLATSNPITPATHPESRPFADSVPAPLGSGTASGLELLMKQQMDAMSRLFEQQLAAVRGAVPLAVPASLAPPATSVPPDAPAGTLLPAAAPDFKAYGPYKPPQRGTKGGLTEQQQQYLDRFIQAYSAKTAESKRLTQLHRGTLADPRVVAGFRLQWKEIVYPIVTVRSSGAKLWDVDGNEYIDILNGFGAIFFGHSPKFVTDAVLRQIESGVEIGPQSALAGEVASLLCELTGTERATFCNTGSEAVMAALRVARTVTGRDKFVYFAGAYHGTFDEVLVRRTGTKSAPIAPGIPFENIGNVIVLEYGAEESIRFIRENAEEIAAVLVEPVQSRNPALQPAQFLQTLRQVTADAGTALIFDEVVTGFRVHPGGAQAHFGIRADMATYGKVIGGGFPIGVLAGKASYLDALDGGMWQYGDESVPEAGVTFFAGTFVRHPLALAAARASLQHLKSAGPGLQEEVGRKAARVSREIDQLFAQYNVPARVHHFASWFYFSIAPEARFGTLLYYHLRAKGVHIQEGFPCFLTEAHTDADLDFVVQAFAGSLAEMRAGGLLPGPVEALGAPPEGNSLLPAPPTLSFPVQWPLHADATGPAGVQAPLTESQREIWLGAHRGDEANCAFNESVRLRLAGPLEVAQLRRALEALVGRHDALRSRISPDGEQLLIEPSLTWELPEIYLTTSEDSAREVEAIVADEGRTPFDLLAGPLFRAALLRVAPAEWILLFTAHHIILDGWSANQLFQELGAIYSAAQTGMPVKLDPLVPFARYAVLEAERQGTPEQAEIELFWVERFSGRHPVLELPTDRPRPSAKTYAGATYRKSLGGALYQALKKAGARQGCTLYATLLSGFQLLLHRLTGQAEVVAGISAAGQSAFQPASLVGHCVHFLPILSELAGTETVADHLQATRRTLLDAYDHQEFTFGTLLRKLSLIRDPRRMPLIEVQFNLERIGDGISFDGLAAELEANPKQFVNTDLFLNVVETADDLTVDCDYNTDLIEPATIARWIDCYRNLLEQMAAEPLRPVAELELVRGTERTRMLADWNRTEAVFLGSAVLHEAIEEQSAITPDATAAVCGGTVWTYRELSERSNRLARYLRRQGVREGTLVGVCLHRSLDMLAAVLAVVKAGGAYVPLDPRHPVDRLAQVLADAQTAVLITEERLAAGFHTEARIVCVDSEQALVARESGARLESESRTDSLAYVIYTSGSTGKPKGVAIEHRALMNLLRSMEREPGLRASDVLVAVTTLSFDIAALELFLPLLAGARVVIATAEQAADGYQLFDLLRASHATILQATPATWRILIEAGWRGDPPLKMLCGGEALPRELANQLLNCGPELWNMYGPTETTVWSSATRVEPGTGPVVIGPPIANTQFYVLDEHREPVPVGVVGELYIGGAGLARGYWHRPELTAQKFLPNPFGDGRIYRSGDLARYQEGGTIELLGRTDFQVKVRGYRIELGEIESTLRKHEAVRDAVVVAQDDGVGHSRLVAYVAVGAIAEEQRTPLTQELTEMLRLVLPEYMVPAGVLVLDSLPRTPNQKVDRRALPPLTAIHMDASISYTPPVTPEQKMMASIWASALNLERVGISSSIFELGADSLLIFRIVARARQQGIPVSPAQIFQHPTIAALSAALAEQSSSEAVVQPVPSAIAAVPRDRHLRTRVKNGR